MLNENTISLGMNEEIRHRNSIALKKKTVLCAFYLEKWHWLHSAYIMQ